MWSSQNCKRVHHGCLLKVVVGRPRGGCDCASDVATEMTQCRRGAALTVAGGGLLAL